MIGATSVEPAPASGAADAAATDERPNRAPAAIDAIDYYNNHYSLLATIEDIFNLKRLGYAKATGLPVIDSSVFDGKGPSGG